MKEQILTKIPTECPWRDTLYWYDTLDSTNTQAKRMAADGATHGTVLIAGQQTGGRGRMGRSFQSPAGTGAYLSVVLRPNCAPKDLMHLTCAAGVAMVSAVEKVAGFRPGIKWINDLVWNRKKLGGILTELSIDPRTGLTEYAVVGIGINCSQQSGEFPPEIQEIAASLSMATGKEIAVADLTGAMVTELWKMSNRLLSQKKQIMDTYRTLCVTLGQEIVVLRADAQYAGRALDMDDDGGLIVALADGRIQTVNSGEVSVRGFYDYV